MQQADFVLREAELKYVFLEEIPGFYNWMQKTSHFDTTAEEILANCLLGHYRLEAGYYKNQLVGMIIYFFKEDTCHIVQVHCENNLRHFISLFYENCRRAGIRKVRTCSDLKNAPYERLTGLERVYSVYEKRL